jgi:hypothetical protein
MNTFSCVIPFSCCVDNLIVIPFYCCVGNLGLLDNFFFFFFFFLCGMGVSEILMVPFKKI